jgi:hypothetical protein
MSSALGLVATGSAGAANDREEIMPVVDPRIAGKPVPRISKETMEHECVARVNNVKALDVAFLDQRIPRYECDIINMVGMGVTETRLDQEAEGTGQLGIEVFRFSVAA